jgi:hypothetical protein
MRKIKVITTQHKPYYDLIGKDCIESFLKYWPKEISMELWAENFVPDISDPRLIIKEFNKINPRFENFKKLLFSLTTSDKVLSKEKLWLKGHVVLTALEESTDDVFIWLDSDVVTHSPIELAYIESLIPENVLSVDIPAGGKGKDKEAETGFFALNLKHPLKNDVIDYYREFHITEKMLHTPRYMETSVWWSAIKIAESKGALTNHLKSTKDHLMPFMYTELSKYMRHWVAPSNKSEYSKGKKEKTQEEE